jgi:hypothetical protein
MFIRQKLNHGSNVTVEFTCKTASKITKGEKVRGCILLYITGKRFTYVCNPHFSNVVRGVFKQPKQDHLAIEYMVSSDRTPLLFPI